MRVIVTAAVLALGLAANMPARAEGDPLAAYYGDWAGAAIVPNTSAEKKSIDMRDTEVSITKAKSGFGLKWKTLIERGFYPHGEDRRVKETALRFVPDGTAGKFRVQFAEPPLGADTDVWAVTKDGSLVVVVSTTSKKGVKRMARYVRAVTGDDMDLKYTLSENGTVVRTVTGALRRVPEHRQKQKLQ